MAFDILKAKQESDVLEGAVADFRTACTKASVKVVEGSNLTFAAEWGLRGDLAELRRLLAEAPATHVFLGAERYDFEAEVAALTGERERTVSVRDCTALRTAASELKALDGLLFGVHAAASLAGVPYACAQVPAWRKRAAAVLQATAERLAAHAAAEEQPRLPAATPLAPPAPPAPPAKPEPPRKGGFLRRG